jgi:hypothetical protein
MTPQQWKNVLKKARRLQKEEEKIDTALSTFCQAVNPSSYNIFVEKGMVHGYLEAIEVCHGIGAREHVSYWLYDVPSIARVHGKCEVKDQHGKVYDASKVSEYVKFVIVV